uniref:ATP synthase complex subunit 8 n=1 Tax=Sternotherus carinatus TaxID=573971 RepID=H9L9P8_9SAUR|nr:ATP synthase F0 subunit 8 [Sternotherus carinatus]ADM94810.1 ATP synthase F0 subunit 8 [Sternotherus carinatus]WLN41549.1 ATP synthase F0 subunit 8 [Sternotherus carinatus]
MPQLNLTPWFTMFLSTWLIYTFILQPKITTHQSMNNPILATETYTHYQFTHPMIWKWT